MTDLAPPGRRFTKAERRRQILLELTLKPHVRTTELAARFGVSGETVRRDVEALSQAGHLRRAYGGASAPHPGSRRDLDQRRRERVAEREMIGRAAVSVVAEGETLMIDAGSTTIQFARFLAFSEKRVTVVTNSLEVAMTLGHGRGARVVLAPGDFVPEEGAVIGPQTLEFLESRHVDRCFLGAAGLSEAGVTESVEGFDAIKRRMLRQSRSRHFLIDASKFGNTHFAHVAGFDRFQSLFTDRAPDEGLGRGLRASGVEVTVCFATARVGATPED
jgi:DeoR/GlpR family transcriptional regulator of sugar metabolism